MIRARHPEGVVALHPLIADQDILQGVVQGVAHVKLARDIGGRHHDRKRFPASVHLGVEILLFHPVCVNPILHSLRIVGLCQFFHPLGPPVFQMPGALRKRKTPFLLRKGVILSCKTRGTTLLRTRSFVPRTSLPDNAGQAWAATLFFTVPAPKLPSADAHPRRPSSHGPPSLYDAFLCVLLFFNAFFLIS